VYQHPVILRALANERRDRYEAEARKPKVDARRWRQGRDRHVERRRRDVVVLRRA
jgi:hypothetical protein